MLGESIPNFPEEVKTLNNIPIPWFWAVLRKKNTAVIAGEVVTFWMHKSHRPFKIMFTYLVFQS